MIELTAEQAQAQADLKTPLQVRDPLTQEVFVLIRQNGYELACGIVRGMNRAGWDNPADDDLIRKRS